MISSSITKTGAILGIIGGLWATISIILAISLSPWFSWWSNALSDLGVSPVAIIFNQGLIICGIFSVVFSISNMVYDKNKLNIAASLTMFLASIWLINIGIFTEDYPPFHFIFSVLFFVFVLISALIYAARFLTDKKLRWIGVYSLIVAVIGIIGWALPVWDGVAIPESLTAFPTVILVILLSYRIIKNL